MMSTKPKKDNTNYENYPHYPIGNSGWDFLKYEEERKRGNYLIIINIGMLIAFIVFSWEQSCQTKNMIRADRIKTRACFELSEMGLVPLKVSNKIEYGVKVINKGYTQALNIGVIGKVKIGTGVTKEEINFISDKKNATYGNSVKSAGSEFVVRFTPQEIVLNSSDSINIKASKAILYAYGCIFYTDIFGIDHWNRFYSYYRCSTDEFIECTSYNDTDKNTE